MQEEFWESIEDMPIYNWNKCLNGQLEYVHKKHLLTDKNEKAFEKIYDEFISFRGTSKYEQKLFTAMKRKVMLECDYLRTGNRMNVTLIEIEEQKIEAIKKEQSESDGGGGFSIEKSLIILSKWLGYRIDWKEVSVKEFYLIIEEYGKQ